MTDDDELLTPWSEQIAVEKAAAKLREEVQPNGRDENPPHDFDKRAPPDGDVSWQLPDAAHIRRKVSFADWLTRDIAAPDFVLGQLLSTTSRILLVGATGLGKTNIALAIAIAVAEGRCFLHWRAGEGPRRVLYIDGEMPERLMRSRLDDAARRLGSKPETLFILSREDFPDMPPLNTEAGQKSIDHVIEAIGGIDLVIFDNIQSLLSGDMKDEEPWQQTLPWVRELTRRKTGQIWIHHTGHDESRSYGTKTREWQLDTVALLEQTERPEVDIAFALRFTKSRERTPDNRSDFEPATITLANDAWASERGNIRGAGKRQAKDRALTLLIDAVVRHGTTPPSCPYIPPNTSCVTVGLWRKACEMGCISEGEATAVRKAFERSAKKLLELGLIGKHDLWVWPVR